MSMLSLLGGNGARFKLGHSWQVGMCVVVKSMVPACKRSSLVVLFRGATNSKSTKRGYYRVGSVAGF